MMAGLGELGSARVASPKRYFDYVLSHAVLRQEFYSANLGADLNFSSV